MDLEAKISDLEATLADNQRRTRRLTGINVLLVTVVLAFGGAGAAYAVAAANSVNSVSIIDGSIVSADIKDGKVKSKDIAISPWTDVQSPPAEIGCASGAYCRHAGGAWTPNGGGGGVGVRFYMDAVGVVHVSGQAQRTTGTGINIFQLPSGYRPSSTLRFVAACGVPTGSRANVLVHSDGIVEYAPHSGDTCGLGNFGISLDAVSFRADQ